MGHAKEEAVTSSLTTEFRTVEHFLNVRGLVEKIKDIDLGSEWEAVEIVQSELFERRDDFRS